MNNVELTHSMQSDSIFAKCQALGVARSVHRILALLLTVSKILMKEIVLQARTGKVTRWRPDAWRAGLGAYSLGVSRELC